MTAAEEYRQRLKRRLAENHKALMGRYKDEIEALMGLSRAEIDEMTPDATDVATYDNLSTVVKQSSAANVALAELKGRIAR